MSHASAGAAYGFRPWLGSFEVVTGEGTDGPRRLPSLLVCHSATLAGNTTMLDGLPITTAERALADLAGVISDGAIARCVRAALRLRVTTCARIQAMIVRAPTRKHTPWRCSTRPASSFPTSTSSSRGLEADFSWPRRRHIFELDGPDFH